MRTNNIEVMDSQLSNMIAAGEVVERPASVVKELVENSIDAGSTKIEIHLMDSGIRQIKVIDNGQGMNSDDANLAFLRHATSKVKTTHDIMRISTLGFRGEALPSIAAVSDVTLKTSNGETEGYLIRLKGGETLKKEPFAIRKGTEIEVNHLFFNTPARLKHIKSLNTEQSHITDYMTKTALANPTVAITLTNNNREVFKTPGATTTQTVLSRIYGFDIAKKMHPLAANNDDFSITGLISEPDVTRASRNYITLIVNNRPIKNYDLVRTIVESYHTYLPKDRFPIVVLNINLDPLLIDVNVHPAKIEVRFSKEESLKTFILTEIKKSLKNLTYIPELILAKKTVATSDPVYKQPSLLKNFTNKQSLDNYNNFRSNSDNSTKKMEINEARTNAYQTNVQTNYEEKVASVVREERAVVIDENIHQDFRSEDLIAPDEVVIDIPSAEKTHLELYYIGQLFGTYLLAQNEEGLFLIDQHAAMERVEYELNYPLLGSAKSDNMELIVPVTLAYPIAEIERVRDKLPQMKQYGFEIEEFGENDLIVRAVPIWAKDQVKSIVETVINTLLSGRDVSIAKLREAVAIMMSCKKSIKANQYINEHEIHELLTNLCKADQPYTCPHGRPIIVKMTKYEIERMFKRA